MNKEYFMKEALKEAEKAYNINEVPIGAVIVRDGEIVGRGFNTRESDKDPTAHAEMKAIRAASGLLGGWRLHQCDMYVTVEPCPMCAGAIIQARIPRVVIGAMNPKAGCAGSILDLLHVQAFNHQVEFEQGMLKETCAKMLSDFFCELRNKKREEKEKTLE